LFTAIPAPLSSFGIIPLAAFGAIRMLTGGPANSTDTTEAIAGGRQPSFLAAGE